jgi:hypothetical protein
MWSRRSTTSLIELVGNSFSRHRAGKVRTNDQLPPARHDVRFSCAARSHCGSIYLKDIPGRSSRSDFIAAYCGPKEKWPATVAVVMTAGRDISTALAHRYSSSPSKVLAPARRRRRWIGRKPNFSQNARSNAISPILNRMANLAHAQSSRQGSRRGRSLPYPGRSGCIRRQRDAGRRHAALPKRDSYSGSKPSISSKCR